MCDSNGGTSKAFASLAGSSWCGATCPQVLSLQEEVDELKRQRKEVLLLMLHPGLHVVANAHAQTPETQTSPSGGRGAG